MPNPGRVQPVRMADRLREALSYDPETGEMRWIAPSKHHSEKVGTIAGTPSISESGKTYWVIGFGGRKYRRGRLAYMMMKGRWPKPMIDHRNGNSLDDRWSNLRQATGTQNSWNHKRRARRIDLPMGVRIIASSGRYSARIAVNKTMHHLGSFDTPEAASAAYQQARRTYYGNYA